MKAVKKHTLIDHRVIINYNYKNPDNIYSGLRGTIIDVEKEKYQVHFPVSEVGSQRGSNDIWFTRKEFVLT